MPEPVRAEAEAAPAVARLVQRLFGHGHGSSAAAGEGGLALGGDGEARGGVAGAHRDRLPNLAGALYPRRVQVRLSRGRCGVSDGPRRCAVQVPRPGVHHPSYAAPGVMRLLGSPPEDGGGDGWR